MGLYQDAREDSSGNVYVNLQDGSANPISSVSGWLDVNIHATSPVSVGVTDQSAFAYGSGVELPVGGVYNDVGASLSAGQTGAFRLTAERGMHVNLRDASGNEIGDANASPVWVRPGDGTNSQAYSGTSEAFVQIRQSGNIANVNASNELLVKDTSADTSLASIDNKLSPATGTISNVVLSTSSQVLLAANPARKGFVIFNDAAKVAYVALSATSATNAFTYRMQANATVEPNFGSYTGIISIIAGSNGGTVYVTELT